LDYEKLGVFYLGRVEGGADEPLLYDAKDLTTHAVIVGMTGSGKTGLGIGLIEEAAIDGIPTIAIDPKGDLGNLLLNFPDLAPSQFEPWVEEGVKAADAASRWAKGLAEWGQDAARVRKLRDAVDMAIYTPGSSAGSPVSILRSLAAPPGSVLDDEDALRERLSGTVAGLLALLGIEADPLRSREHILLSTLCQHAWSRGADLDLAGLIRDVQRPPFDRVGVVDLESFYPAKARADLAMTLNNLLASPGFAAWLTGEPLDVARMLWTPEGKPRIAVVSIAHLGDAERMFFVTLLLNEIVAWMRGQSGTSTLRAMLYMDEVFGYFPPVANPPAKAPMLTLLKQARAFGLGCVLSTQNPVDLDYKGLSNAGTWFLGRLQTERDKARVIEGLEGARAAAGKDFDRQTMEATLAGLGKRVFLMNDVHEDAPVLFHTRWTLSYLRGPLTKAQIQRLMAERKGPAIEKAAASGSGTPEASRPSLPAGVTEAFLRPSVPPQGGEWLAYRPALLGRSKIHFVASREKVDSWSDRALLLPLDGEEVSWDRSESLPAVPELASEPAPAAGFDPLPAAAARAKSYAEWGRALSEALYRTAALELRSAPELELMASPGESEGAFAVRVREALRVRRDAAIDALRKKYAAKLESATLQERRAEERVTREQSQASQQAMQTAISVGATVLGALFGRKTFSASSVGRATTAARGMSRTMRERDDVGTAQGSLDGVRAKRTELEAELQREIDALSAAAAPESVAITTASIKPRKSDIVVEGVALCWVPYWAGPGGSSRPAR
jgi:uncharacterized protein DUF87